jgi:hypothetical protein
MKSRSTESPTPPRTPRPPVRRAIDTVRDLAPAVTAISALTATIFHVLYSYRMGVPLLGELAATSFVVVTFAGMVLLVALFQFAAFFPFIALGGLDDQDQADLRAALAGPDTRKRGQWGAWADAKGFAVCFGWIYWAALLALALLGGLAGNQGDGILLWFLISALIVAAIAANFRLKGPEAPAEILRRMAATLKLGVPLAFHVAISIAVFAIPAGVLLFESSPRAFAWLGILAILGAAAFHYLVVSDRFSRDLAIRIGLALAVLAIVAWPGASYLYARALYTLGTGGGFLAELETKDYGGVVSGFTTKARTRCVLLVTPSTVFVRAGNVTNADRCRVRPLGPLEFPDPTPLRDVEAIARVEIVRFGPPR